MDILVRHKDDYEIVLYSGTNNLCSIPHWFEFSLLIGSCLKE